MQVSLTNPPKIFTIQKVNFPYPHWKLSQVRGRAGDVGKILPHANLAIPNKRVINELKPAIAFTQQPQTKPFNYGTASSYRKFPELLEPSQTTLPTDFNRVDDLPLFKKT